MFALRRIIFACSWRVKLSDFAGVSTLLSTATHLNSPFSQTSSPVLLSVVSTDHTAQTIVWRLLLASTCVLTFTLAVATTQGQNLFHFELPNCLTTYYMRVLTIQGESDQGNTVAQCRDVCVHALSLLCLYFSVWLLSTIRWRSGMLIQRVCRQETGIREMKDE